MKGVEWNECNNTGYINNGCPFLICAKSYTQYFLLTSFYKTLDMRPPKISVFRDQTRIWIDLHMCKILNYFSNSFVVIKDSWIFCKIPQVYAKHIMILQDYLTSGKIQKDFCRFGTSKRQKTYTKLGKLAPKNLLH